MDEVYEGIAIKGATKEQLIGVIRLQARKVTDLANKCSELRERGGMAEQVVPYRENAEAIEKKHREEIELLHVGARQIADQVETVMGKLAKETRGRKLLLAVIERLVGFEE